MKPLKDCFTVYDEARKRRANIINNLFFLDLVLGALFSTYIIIVYLIR